MTAVHFQIGVKRTPRVVTPPGVPPRQPEWQTLAEKKLELDDDQLAELSEGFLEIAFPVRALQGRAGLQDAIAVRVGLPDHKLIDGSVHPDVQRMFELRDKLPELEEEQDD